MPTHLQEVRGFLDHHVLDTIRRLGLREIGVNQMQPLLDLRVQLRREIQHALFLTEDVTGDLRDIMLPGDSPIMSVLEEARTFLQNILKECALRPFLPPSLLREIHRDIQLMEILCPDERQSGNRLARWLRA